MSYQTPKVIALNGPPGVGKDYAAQAIKQHIEETNRFIRPKLFKLADPLKKGIHAAFELFHSPEHYDSPQGIKEGLKDKQLAQLLGLSPREMYISMSEDWLKPCFGQDVMGRIAVQKLIKDTTSSLFISSDAGFAVEWLPIIDHFGPKNVLLLQLHADGKTFENDSRSYIGTELRKSYPKLGIIDITNTFGDADDREMFRLTCAYTVAKFIDLVPH